VYERHGRELAPAHRLDHREREPAHRPPTHDVWAEVVEMLAQDAIVVAGHGHALRGPLRAEAAGAPVPAQLPMHVGVVRAGVAGAKVGRQHAHVVAARAEELHRRPPHQLVAAEMMRRIHVPRRQDTHAPRIEFARVECRA
jgi:hypothetical protein